MQALNNCKTLKTYWPYATQGWYFCRLCRSSKFMRPNMWADDDTFTILDGLHSTHAITLAISNSCVQTEVQIWDLL